MIQTHQQLKILSEEYNSLFSKNEFQPLITSLSAVVQGSPDYIRKAFRSKLTGNLLL
jgi:hypothetical protein